ncbi:hypothetical protein [Siccirubricoccus phaeus]
MEGHRNYLPGRSTIDRDVDVQDLINSIASRVEEN